MTILRLWKDQALILLQHLNSQHPCINFEIEFPTEENNSLCLLDFNVKLDASSSTVFEFYCKPAKKNIFVNHKSHIPQTMKLNYVMNERARIKERCSNILIHNKHEAYFDNTLRLNDYPETTIKISKRKRSKNNFLKSDKDFLYFPFPFISDKVDKQIQNVFRRENMSVRLTRRNRTLRSALKHHPSPQTCELRNCPLNDQMLCNKKKVVYKIECKNCKKFYIGSTTRPLHTRCREHATNINSSVHRHLITCNRSATFSESTMTSVISTDKDCANLRLREAYFINTLKPELNDRVELNSYKDFLFH